LHLLRGSQLSPATAPAPDRCVGKLASGSSPARRQASRRDCCAGATFLHGDISRASRAGQTPAIISDRVSSIIDYPHSVPGEGERSCYSRVLHSERRRPVTGNTTWRGRSDLLGWHICSPKFASIRSFGIGRRMGTVKSAPSTLLRFMLNSTTNGGRPLRHLCDVSLWNNVYFFESSRIYQYIHSRNFRG
jgi:hypothetical protein